MKAVILFLIASLLVTDLDKIGKINSAKSEAKKAFLEGKFKIAIEKYKYLIDSLGVNEEEVRANLASAYFQANDTASAVNAYQQLAQSSNKKINSVANQQLGVMANNTEKLEEALQYFKQALKAAPENEDARYNYEVVKKKLEEKKKQQQENKDQKDQDKKDDQKKDQNKDQKKDQKDQKDKQDKDKKEQEKKEQEKKDKESKDQLKKEEDKKDDKGKDKEDQKGKEDKEKEQKEKEQQQKDEKNKEKKDLPPSVKDKLKDMQMSEEKAKMILEAMKNQEVQYLQQNKRKATKPRDKGKPDW
jgi:Ca-activated chloride channel homolog